MNKICEIENRGVVTVSGEDRVSFLQGLVSNDVTKLSAGNPIYACLLTPQGKFLHDFVMTDDEGTIYLECERDRADELVKTLKIYALRADVKISNLSDGYKVYASWGGDSMEGFYIDQRHTELGYRAIYKKDVKIQTNVNFEEYDRHRILLAVPDGSRDMKPKFSTLLESNIDKLNGISWDKGCYTGQELTARMHYRGTLKKCLVVVTDENLPKFGTEILDDDGHIVGEMRSSCGDVGLALIKLSAIENNDKLTMISII